MQRRRIQSGGLAFALASLTAAVVSAQVPCPPCSEWSCLNHPDFVRAREAKRAQMRAFGYPDRLIALLDRVSPCPRCIHMSPDGFSIVMEYTPDSPEGRRGVGWHSMGWTRALEREARAALRRGELRAFHVIQSAVPCECCGQFDARPEDRADWNARLEINMDLALSYSNPRALGPDPSDLREPDPPDLPPVPPPMEIPQERIAHPVCRLCAPIADARNDVARRVNELRRLLRRRQWELQITEQALAREFAHGMRRSHGTDVERFPADVRAQLDARLQERDSSRAERDDARRQLVEAEAQLRARHAELLACEARPCVEPPPPRAASSADPSRATAVPPTDGRVPRTATPLAIGLHVGGGIRLLQTDSQFVAGLNGSFAVTHNRLGRLLFSPAVGLLGGSITVYLPLGFGYLIPTPLAWLYISTQLSLGYVGQIFSAGRVTYAQHGILVLPEIGLRFVFPSGGRALWFGADLVSVPIFLYPAYGVALTYRLLALAAIQF